MGYVSGMGSCLSAITLMAVAAVTCSCERQSDTQTRVQGAKVVGLEDKVYEIGETAGSRHFSLTVKNLRVCAPEPHLQPPAGVTTLGVQVEIIGNSALEVPANVFYAHLITETGTRFESTLAGCKPVLSARRLGQGDSARGWISFHVPDKYRRFEFLYQPVVIGATRQQTKFRLEL